MLFFNATFLGLFLLTISVNRVSKKVLKVGALHFPIKINREYTLKVVS